MQLSHRKHIIDRLSRFKPVLKTLIELDLGNEGLELFLGHAYHVTFTLIATLGTTDSRQFKPRASGV